MTNANAIAAGQFSVGDTVWRPASGTMQVKKTCPVCFGKLHVTVILGDDSLVDTPCDYCGKGWDGPKGFEIVYEYAAKAEVDSIAEIRVTTTHQGQIQEYRLASGHMMSRVFASRDEAMAAADAERLKHDAEEEQRRKWGKEQSEKSFSWHVGYHSSQIKEHRRRLEYHEARVQPCRDAARIERAAKRTASPTSRRGAGK